MNPSTTTLDLNVGYPSVATICHAVQGDIQSRIITANLYDGGVEWVPPSGAIGTIRFRTPLGTSGFYDTDEEGNTAVTWTGNVATLRIVQNAIAVAGDVPMQLSFYDGNGQVLTTFQWETLVQPSVLTDTQFMQTDYYNLLSKQINAVLGASAYPPIINPTTKNWMLWDTETNSYVDSGYSSVGTKGDQGDQGVSITRIQRTSGTGAAGTNDTYTVYLSNGTTAGTFIVHNGSNGTNGTNGLSIGRIEKTSGTGAAGTTDTYTVYLSDNTSVGTFNVYNGSDGAGSPGTQLPLMDGEQGAVGTAIAYSREDHRHPTDTSRVPTTRTVNGKPLGANITLSASDIPNDSTVEGENVDDALDALLGSITSLENSLTVVEMTSSNTTLLDVIAANISAKSLPFAIVKNFDGQLTDVPTFNNSQSYRFTAFVYGNTDRQTVEFHIFGSGDNVYVRNILNGTTWSGIWIELARVDEAQSISAYKKNSGSINGMSVPSVGKQVDTNKLRCYAFLPWFTDGSYNVTINALTIEGLGSLTSGLTLFGKFNTFFIVDAERSGTVGDIFLARTVCAITY